MKTKLITWTMAAALAVLIAVPTLAGPNPKPAPAAAPAGQGAGKHPNVVEAMQALETAKKHLKAAPREFGGHRVEAIRHIDAAIVECRAALDYAKDHND